MAQAEQTRGVRHASDKHKAFQKKRAARLRRQAWRRARDSGRWDEVPRRMTRGWAD